MFNGAEFSSLRKSFTVALSAFLSCGTATAQPGFVLSLPSIAQMKALGASSKYYSNVNVQSYYAGGTGGGGLFVWDPTSTATANNGVIVAATGVSTGRWIRQLQDMGTVSILDFGAVCDNMTDDYTAIQAAVDYAGTHPLSSNYGTVIFPAADCRWGTTVNVYYPISIKGAGSAQTLGFGIGFSGGSYLFNFDGAVHPVTSSRIQGVQFSGITLGFDNSAGNIIKINNVALSNFTDIGIRNAVNAITITGTETFSDNFENINCAGTLSGHSIYINNLTSGNGQLSFRNSSFCGTDAFFYDATSDSTGMLLENNDYEGYSTTGILIQGSAWGLNIVSPRFEHGGSTKSLVIAPTSGNVIGGLSISGGSFRTTSEVNGIVLGGGGGTIRGFSITANDAINYSGDFILLSGTDAQSGQIDVNFIENVTSLVNTTRVGVVFCNNSNTAGAVQAVCP